MHSEQPCSDGLYRMIGLMSGTSLDGLDIAYCTFSCIEGNWKYSIEKAVTVSYPAEWKVKLGQAEHSSARELVALHSEFGSYCGRLVRGFIKEYGLRPDHIASHGHTVFHRPDLGYTFQLGNGADIAAVTGCPVISDFRSADVALGGQGAPLVPVGDKLLFSAYGHCLNIGGFANISHERMGSRLAFDICPANIVLNMLAEQAGQAYDEGGCIAASGSLIPQFLDELNGLKFYSLEPPKSLGREWLTVAFLPLLEKYCSYPLNDRLHTVVEHIAWQIAKTISHTSATSVLATGGGALNTYLVERIKTNCDADLIVPDIMTVQYKEALIFAFLGVLRLRGENNCLSSVTGASGDHCSGVIFPAQTPQQQP